LQPQPAGFPAPASGVIGSVQGVGGFVEDEDGERIIVITEGTLVANIDEVQARLL